jgi:hypothetical protein
MDVTSLNPPLPAPAFFSGSPWPSLVEHVGVRRLSRRIPENVEGVSDFAERCGVPW